MYSSRRRHTLSGKNPTKQEKCLFNKSQNMNNDPLTVQRRALEERRPWTGNNNRIHAACIGLSVFFLQMQHFEQVITEQTEEMSWQLCVSTHEVDLFIFPRRGIWGAGISTFTRWPRKLSLMMPKAIWLKQTVQTAEHIGSQPETCRNFHTAFIWSKIPIGLLVKSFLIYYILKM